jgi:hypothetical protein
MNSNTCSAKQEYKTCAGKGCSENGHHYLKIRFINKYGWFCESCTDIIVNDRLADEIKRPE